MKLSLKDRLVAYLKKNHGYIASGDLQRIVAKYTTYTPRTTCRRLEELAETGILEVEYRKGHAWYKYSSFQETPKPPTSEYLDSLRRSQIAFFDSYGVHTA